jgi:hypothetical protein
MIGAMEALAAAEPELYGAPVRIDPKFALFAEASIGEPLLVHDLAKRPSYWLVPVLLGEKVVGFVRVSQDGGVEAIGSYCRDRSRLAECPDWVTHITSDEAERRARPRLDTASDEVASPPVYVHDGPPGREAWLVETSAHGQPVRRLFLTASGMYERPASRSGQDEPAANAS